MSDNSTIKDETTDLVADLSEVQLRQPQITDVPGIVDVINHYARAGLMLARSRHATYQSLRDFVVAVDGDKVVGCGALSVIWEDLCEVRSLAVDPAYVGRGVGRQIVEALIDDARSLGLPRVFALTYQAGFFAHLGFAEVQKETLPHKIWGDCLNCPKFPNCDEIAMMRELDPDQAV